MSATSKNSHPKWAAFGLLVLMPLVAQPAGAALMIEVAGAPEAVPTPQARVIERIHQASRSAAEYLSLGETHLFAPMNRLYMKTLAEEYFSNSVEPITSCVENLSESDESQVPLLAALKQWSSAYITLNGNGPSNTNFQGCSDPAKKWFTYSGLFHQFPSPRMFPEDFELTPVATQPGNTISTQLVNQHGVFVSAFDVMYVQNQAANAVLKTRYLDPADFRARVAEVEADFMALRAKMEVLTGNTPELKTRAPIHGAFFDRTALASAPESLQVMPESAFVLLMDPEYRFRSEKNLLLLDRLQKHSDRFLKNLLTYAQAPENYTSFTNIFDFLDAEFRPAPSYYGLLLEPLPVGSEILEISDQKDPDRKPVEILLLASPDQPDLRCFKINMVTYENRELGCGLIFDQPFKSSSEI